MRRPLFSVIIPTLNEEKFLPKLLASLSEQTQKNFEVIVVDGSSKDKTVRVATSYARKFPHLQVIVSKTASLPLQRNLGAKAARGEWFVFVDADSILMPYFVERVQRFIQERQPQFFTTWAQPDSHDVNDAIFTLFTNIYFEGSIKFKRQLAPGPLTLIQSDVFRSIGGYDETHAFHEDVELGLRLASKGIDLMILREALFIYSMRRIRREGKLKVMQQYVASIFPVLLFKHPFKYMPGYIMGGQLYGRKKKINRSVLKVYERKLKQLLKEFFG